MSPDKRPITNEPAPFELGPIADRHLSELSDEEVLSYQQQLEAFREANPRDWLHENWRNIEYTGPPTRNPPPTTIDPPVYSTEGLPNEDPPPRREEKWEISGKQMILEIPSIDLYNVLVSEGVAEDGAMYDGVGHVRGTDWPWDGDDSQNVYLAGHRLGYRYAFSNHIFVRLPYMDWGDLVILEDSDGVRYYYRVFQKAQIHPPDGFMLNKQHGVKKVSLQTCINDVADEKALGPEWFARFVIQARQIKVVRPEEV